MATRIKDVHLQFVILLYRKLTPPDAQFVDAVFQRDTSVLEIAESTAVTITVGNSSHLVSVGSIQELKLAQPLTNPIMTGIWKLFEKRDCRISSAHREVNDGRQAYHPYKPSYFIPGDFLNALENDFADVNILQTYFPAK